MRFEFKYIQNLQELLDRERAALAHGRHCFQAAVSTALPTRGKYFALVPRSWLSLQQCMLAGGEAALSYLNILFELFAKHRLRLTVQLTLSGGCSARLIGRAPILFPKATVVAWRPLLVLAARSQARGYTVPYLLASFTHPAIDVALPNR